MVFKLNIGIPNPIKRLLVEFTPVGKNRTGQGLGAGVVADGHADSLARERELLRARAVHIGADLETAAAYATNMTRRASSDATTMEFHM